MPPPSSEPREPIVGPENPEQPFPLKLKGKVIKGFGRGSKEVCQPSSPTRVIFPLPMRQLRSPLPFSPRVYAALFETPSPSSHVPPAKSQPIRMPHPVPPPPARALFFAKERTT